jgi:hypothetical protein
MRYLMAGWGYGIEYATRWRVVQSPTDLADSILPGKRFDN